MDPDTVETPSGEAAPTNMLAGDNEETVSTSRGSRGPGQGSEPLNVRVEIRVVDGEAGRELARRQAAVVRDVLRWLNEHPQPARPESS